MLATARAEEQRLRSWLRRSVEESVAIGLDEPARADAARQRAVVHDGVLQLLGAVLAGYLETPVLERWIADERVRVVAMIDHPDLVRRPPATRSLAGAVSQLADEFLLRGLNVDTACGAVPAWADATAPSVVGLVREALANVAKHTSCAGAAVTVATTGEWVAVTVTDESTSVASVIPGSGVGTTAMAECAASLGADIEWRCPATGGTTMCLRLMAPTV